ncbi:MAG: hypothetical protein AB1705_08565 [Verrucomicrobiota bacterium]
MTDAVIETADMELGELSGEQAAELNARLDAAEAAEAGTATATAAPPADSAPTQPPPGTAGKPGTPAASQPPNGGAPGTEPAKPVEGDAKPAATEAAKPGDQPPGGGAKGGDAKGAPSKYEKERQRQQSTWEKINERKTELDRREQELAEREKRAAGEQFTAEDYEQYARKCEAEGKLDLAELARAEAKRVREAAAGQAGDGQGGGARGRTEAEEAELVRKQTEYWNQAKAEMPDLVVKDSELNKGVRELIKKNPHVLEYPDGPYMVAQFVKRGIEAARVPGLQKSVDDLTAKVTALEARNKELEKLTSVAPGGSPPNIAQGEKSFDELTPAEQEAWLNRTYAEST